MFPFNQRSNELYNQISSIPCQQQEDQILDHASLEGSAINPTNINNDTTNFSTTSDVNINKRVIRREIERQRRLEITTLHASLQSLLPFELIKGNAQRVIT